MAGITRRGLAAAALAMAAPACAKPAAVETWPDATEMADRIRRRELSAAEAVQAAIERAERLQGRLNFLVTSDFDRALAKARAGAAVGPFSGVPFLVKDLNDYAGLPTRMGSRLHLRDPAKTAQTPYVDAFDRLGLIVIGKSATPEYGFLPTTEPVAFGPTRNPWDPARSSGGSSGGAAAAVAAGVVPFAHASDGGGSIRIPASNCGLFGLKPSRGRMIGARGEIAVTDLGVDHCLTRSVRDSAALFALTEDSGPDARFAPVGLVGGPSRRRLRIGYLIENGLGHGPQPDVARATEDAAKLVRELGHEVQVVHWPMNGEEFGTDFLTVWAGGAAEIVRGVRKAIGRTPGPDLLEPFTLGLADMAAKAGPEAVSQAIERLEANAVAYDTWFVANEIDVVLSPVLSSRPPLIGQYAPTLPFDELVGRLMEFVGYTPIHNVAGAPAMSVPLSWTAEGLPIGTMFAARAGNERTLFELAYQLEAARPWAGRTPPLHA